jgi:hypothetical protein
MLVKDGKKRALNQPLKTRHILRTYFAVLPFWGMERFGADHVEGTRSANRALNVIGC